MRYNTYLLSIDTYILRGAWALILFDNYNTYEKFILLISLVAASNLSTTQVLNEKFESVLGLSKGWTNNDIDSNGEAWTFDNTGDAPYFESGNALLTAFGLVGNHALFNSFGNDNNGDAENAALADPSFSCVGNKYTWYEPELLK